MSGSTHAWQPEIDWSTPAGEALTKLCEAVPAARGVTITVFESAPLQLAIEASFKSNDVDIYPVDDDPTWLSEIVAQVGLEKSLASFYIQCCWEGNFRTSPRWRHRAAAVPRGNATLLLPAPIDILIAKLHRYEEKDANAFRLVIDRTGHPTEQEFLTELQFSVDLFRPAFDELSGDITTNTAIMWPEMFGRSIDVRREIIGPALARLREGYAPDVPQRDYQADLRRLGNEP
jgi:hypothetical protein